MPSPLPCFAISGKNKSYLLLGVYEVLLGFSFGSFDDFGEEIEAQETYAFGDSVICFNVQAKMRRKKVLWLLDMNWCFKEGKMVTFFLYGNNIF